MSVDLPVAATLPPFTECVAPAHGAPETRADSPQIARRLQELIQQIQSQTNPAARELLQECLQTMLAFYGAGLGRILEHVQASGDEGKIILDKIARDPAATSLLMVHGLHPVPLETRLRGALESVRPYMQSHGGNIELLGLENEVARVKLEGACKTCPSSAITLELAVRRAVEEACPDLLGFEVC